MHVYLCFCSFYVAKGANVPASVVAHVNQAISLVAVCLRQAGGVDEGVARVERWGEKLEEFGTADTSNFNLNIPSTTGRSIEREILLVIFCGGFCLTLRNMGFSPLEPNHPRLR